MSYPLYGTINIESNIKSVLLTLKYGRDIVNMNNNDLQDMVVIDTKLIDEDPERAFSLIHYSKIAVVSEEVDLFDLFVQMKKITLKNKRRFDGL